MYLHEAIKNAGEGGRIRRKSWKKPVKDIEIPINNCRSLIDPNGSGSIPVVWIEARPTA